MEQDKLISHAMGDNEATGFSQSHSQDAPRLSEDPEERVMSPTPQNPPLTQPAELPVTHPWTRLHHSQLVLLWVSVYATLAIFAWAVICILASHPITGTGSYGR
jgi:hypothetical protein